MEPDSSQVVTALEGHWPVVWPARCRLLDSCIGGGPFVARRCCLLHRCSGVVESVDLDLADDQFAALGRVHGEEEVACGLGARPAVVGRRPRGGVGRVREADARGGAEGGGRHPGGHVRQGYREVCQPFCYTREGLNLRSVRQRSFRSVDYV